VLLYCFGMVHRLFQNLPRLFIFWSAYKCTIFFLFSFLQFDLCSNYYHFGAYEYTFKTTIHLASHAYISVHFYFILTSGAVAILCNCLHYMKLLSSTVCLFVARCSESNTITWDTLYQVYA